MANWALQRLICIGWKQYPDCITEHQRVGWDNGYLEGLLKLAVRAR